jgi:hypothetical protein
MKTTAHIPPSVAAQYNKLERPSAASQAVADGYTKTKEMQKARSTPAKGQFGLPKSTMSGKTRLTGKRM